jgi:sulfur-carrier protein adenylyltransferase/sulfurtransferase
MSVEEIPPAELQRRQARATPPRLVDVREPWEVAIAAIPGAIHIPLNELPQRLAELDPAVETVVMCKAGSRSLRAALFLESRGFGHVANLTGGIDAWARDVDPALQSY